MSKCIKEIEIVFVDVLAVEPAKSRSLTCLVLPPGYVERPGRADEAAGAGVQAAHDRRHQPQQPLQQKPLHPHLQHTGRFAF